MKETLLLCALFCFALFGYSSRTTADQGESIKLPDPNMKGSVTLEQALVKRRSVREYAPGDLSIEQLGQLLWAGQGFIGGKTQRTAPSAGALFPMTLYVVKKEGTYRYDPQKHLLNRVSQEDLRDKLSAVALGQKPIANAPVSIVLVADVSVTAKKYKSRAPRYCFIEAGHIAQNIALQAAALGLGAVTIGAFEDEKVLSVLGAPGDRQACYVIPVGRLK